MPESKRRAETRAVRLGFPKSSVVKADKGGYYIAPHGIKSSAAKHAYADIRASGESQEKAAKIAWSIEHKE
jgi:hypothetical protein